MHQPVTRDQILDLVVDQYAVEVSGIRELTTSQLASVLRVSEATIKRWADTPERRLRSRRVDGDRLFSLKDVAFFLAVHPGVFEDRVGLCRTPMADEITERDIMRVVVLRCRQDLGTTALLTTKQVSMILKTSEATLKRWNLPCLRTPGAHRRFRAEDVAAYIEANRITAWSDLNDLGAKTGNIRFKASDAAMRAARLSREMGHADQA